MDMTPPQPRQDSQNFMILSQEQREKEMIKIISEHKDTILSKDEIRSLELR